MENLMNNKSHMPGNSSSYNVLQELECERKRIARELHDSTIQMLTILIYKAEFCEKVVEKDAIRTKMELQIMIELLKESIDEIRNTIYDLHPMSIEDLGLIASVERYLIFLNRDTNIDFTLKVNGEEKCCLPIVNISLYRVIQESCNNIMKHSQATKASIDILYTDDIIQLKIQDNGVGFKQKSTYESKETEMLYDEIKLLCKDKKNGFGIPMMRERVKLLGGEFEIVTDTDGTMIKIFVPLPNHKEEFNEQD